eukprot:UN08183
MNDDDINMAPGTRNRKRRFSELNKIHPQVMVIFGGPNIINSVINADPSNQEKFMEQFKESVGDRNDDPYIQSLLEHGFIIDITPKQPKQPQSQQQNQRGANPPPNNSSQPGQANVQFDGMNLRFNHNTNVNFLNLPPTTVPPPLPSETPGKNH